MTYRDYEKSDSLCTHTIIFVLPIHIVYPFSNRLPIITMGNNISTLRAVATVTFICAAKLHELVSNQSNANQEQRADIYRDEATNPNHNPLIRINNLADRSLLAAVTSEEFHEQTKKLLRNPPEPNKYPRFSYETETQAEGSQKYVHFNVIARVKGTVDNDWQYYVYIIGPPGRVCILQWGRQKSAVLTGCIQKGPSAEWLPTEEVMPLSDTPEGIPQISQADGDQNSHIERLEGGWDPRYCMYLLTSGAEPMNSVGFHEAANKAIKKGDGESFLSFFYKKEGTEEYQEFKLERRVKETEKNDWQYIVSIKDDDKETSIVLMWGKNKKPLLVPYHGNDKEVVVGPLPPGISQISDTAGKPIVGPGR